MRTPNGLTLLYLVSGAISRRATARFVEYEANNSVIETEAETPSVLVVSEINYPGWTATIDGTPTPIHATNFLLRGVGVPAGRHRVEMRYRAPAARVKSWTAAVSSGKSAAWRDGCPHGCELFDTPTDRALMCRPVNDTEPHSDSKTVAIIPARYHATRLPGKPLLKIAGRPMILYTVERALAAPSVDRVIVATDDRRIFDAVRGAGFEAAMTSSDHQSGSDRLAEVAAELHDTEIIVNVQGDEPMISAETIERAVIQIKNDREAPVVTTSEPVADAAAVLSPDVVKVVVDEAGRALLFSRSPIPYPRNAVYTHGSLEAALRNDPQVLATFRKHTGLYVYRRAFLLEYAGWPPSTLERIESLEQLRVLERGMAIRVVEAAAPSVGVDTAEDLELVRALIEKERSI